MRSLRLGLAAIVMSLVIPFVDAEEPIIRMDEIQEAIRDAEYHVTWQDQTVLPDLDAAWHAANRAQNLRFYFTGDEVRVVDRTAEGSPELLRLKLLSPSGSAVLPVNAVPDNNKLTLGRGQEAESYANTIKGLEHQFTVTEDHAGDGKPMIEIEWSAAVIEVHDHHLDFKAASGRRSVLRIVDARDATGASAEAIFAVVRDAVRITFPGTNMVFPVTVKTLLSATADTILEGNSLNRLFGSGVAVGDVNGDGFADVVAAVPGWDNGQDNEGAVMVFHGRPGGIASNGSDPIGPAANTVIETNLAHLSWPSSLAIVGDLNGDGFEDLVVGSPRWDPVHPGLGSTFWGAIWIFHGSATGIAASELGDSNGFVASDRTMAAFGDSVSGAGDVNGDGHADVIVGATIWDNVTPAVLPEGAAFVFHGSSSGITATTTAQADSRLEGNVMGVYAGSDVAGLGDVNGDGYDDVAIGIHELTHPEIGEGGIAILFGSSSGVASNPGVPLDVAANALLEGNLANANLTKAAGAGDVNGDGYSDVVVGFHQWGDSVAHAGEGLVAVFHGSSTGIEPNASTDLAIAADTAIQGNPNPHRQITFGRTVSGGADLNGDGFADIMAGSPNFSDSHNNEGGVFVFYGGDGGISSSETDPVEQIADVVVDGDMADTVFGYDPALAGDVNGDGFDDLVVPSRGYSSPDTDEGAVFIYHGGAEMLAEEPDDHHDETVADTWLGFAVASVGDLNGDGYSDFAVGAPLYDGSSLSEGKVHVFFGSSSPSLTVPDWTFEGQYWMGETGASVASAGDLNGDGYGDLAIGTPRLNNPEIGEGRVDVFYGSTSGLASSSDWSYEADLDDARLGNQVASAGDIDADGYGDLIVGAPGYSEGQYSEGRAYVFFGSPQGLAASPDWTYQSDIAQAQFGNSVASAGDVNGDGYGDVIIGAPGYELGQTREGAAYGFRGGPSGLPDTPNWFIQTNRTNTEYGGRLAAAGDVNGDGFGDVVVGAATDSNGETSEGRAYVYHGSAGGLSTSADRVLEQNIASAGFGAAVAGAGDVNGDGFADLVVGSPTVGSPSFDGRAYLFLGMAAGVAGEPAWFIERPGAGVWLGSAVAGIGDFNGDGFSDVVIGVPGSDAGAADGGSVELYLGNAGAGRPVLARQFRGGDDPNPVQPWGLTHSGDDFQISMTAISPRGRELAKLHVEACPPGEVWGDVDCRHAVSADWTAIPLGENGVVLTETISSLTEGVLYRWRAHVLYLPLHGDEPGITEPPAPRHGPWRTLFAMAPAADIRVGIPQQITIELATISSSVDEGAPQAEVEVVMTTSDGEASEVDSSVDFDTFNGTAVAGEDYVHTSFNRFFSAGTASGTVQTIEVGLINDDLDEPDEDFVVELYNPVGAMLGPQNTHAVTILDDDPPPELSALDVEVSEGVGVATITLELSAPTSFEVTVDFATVDGSATAPMDYVSVSGTVMIPPMDITATVEIPIEDDWLGEALEFFTLELTNPANAVLVAPTVTITIMDDDAGILFADGFESGDTGRWTGVTP